MTTNELSIKFEENVLFLIVDKFDDELERTPEETAELNQKNQEWITATLVPKLLSLSGFCPCRMSEVYERAQRRQTILQGFATDGGDMIQLTQEDVDTYKYVVVVVAEHDQYESISLIIRECKKCNKLDFWGDSTMLGTAMGRIINESYTLADMVPAPAEDASPEEGITDIDVTSESPLGEGAVFEDLETGEFVGGADAAITEPVT